ncbi:hypothetical protein CAAN1_08S03554 [[Candida] anglica]|uniref:Uncharacterized protein n=1 Tax=[Candida] anglica TaxID=148631 RepID=A0ABP0E5R1_9ASCO
MKLVALLLALLSTSSRPPHDGNFPKYEDSYSQVQCQLVNYDGVVPASINVSLDKSSLDDIDVAVSAFLYSDFKKIGYLPTKKQFLDEGLCNRPQQLTPHTTPSGSFIDGRLGSGNPQLTLSIVEPGTYCVFAQACTGDKKVAQYKNLDVNVQFVSSHGNLPHILYLKQSCYKWYIPLASIFSLILVWALTQNGFGYSLGPVTLVYYTIIPKIVFYCIFYCYSLYVNNNSNTTKWDLEKFNLIISTLEIVNHNYILSIFVQLASGYDPVTTNLPWYWKLNYGIILLNLVTIPVSLDKDLVLNPFKQFEISTLVRIFPLVLCVAQAMFQILLIIGMFSRVLGRFIIRKSPVVPSSWHLIYLVVCWSFTLKIAQSNLSLISIDEHIDRTSQLFYSYISHVDSSYLEDSGYQFGWSCFKEFTILLFFYFGGNYEWISERIGYRRSKDKLH